MIKQCLTMQGKDQGPNINGRSASVYYTGMAEDLDSDHTTIFNYAGLKCLTMQKYDLDPE